MFGVGHKNIQVQCQNPDCDKRPVYVTSWAAFQKRRNKCPVCGEPRARELEED